MSNPKPKCLIKMLLRMCFHVFLGPWAPAGYTLILGGGRRGGGSQVGGGGSLNFLSIIDYRFSISFFRLSISINWEWGSIVIDYCSISFDCRFTHKKQKKNSPAPSAP